MSFSDEDFDKAKSAGVSDTQLYKQAGNSIVVQVLYYIFKELYAAMPYLFDDLRVSSFFSGIGAFEKGLDRLYEDLNSSNESGGRRLQSRVKNHRGDVTLRAVILSNCGRHFEHETDCSCTLLARDYKGFGNQGMTGVIEEKVI